MTTTINTEKISYTLSEWNAISEWAGYGAFLENSSFGEHVELIVRAWEDGDWDIRTVEMDGEESRVIVRYCDESELEELSENGVMWDSDTPAYLRETMKAAGGASYPLFFEIVEWLD